MISSFILTNIHPTILLQENLRYKPVPPAENHFSTINCPNIKDDESHLSAYHICDTKRKKLFYFISFGGKLFKNYRRYHSVVHTY
mmetsp:Transcript_4743/g.10104  ORF Transcript_4743/g.10104 Transcript_4743/m.10104 type:complete len:85 (-) Transcript_4743:316-570(-)